MRELIVVAFVLVAAACGDDSEPFDAGRDTADSASDAPIHDAPTSDAAADAADAADAEDASLDAFDAGPGGPADPFDGIGDIELVAESHEDVNFQFLEGPHWRPDGTLVFSDLAFGAPGNATIYVLTPPSTIAILRRPSGGANGNATAPDGELVTCLQADRKVVRGTATATDVVTEYMGDPLNAPNDLVFRSDGTWYFTDPGYGVADPDLAFRGVFRVTPGDELFAEYTDAESRRPNGIALSPDEGTLYVSDTEAGVVRAFDVAPDGSLSEGRLFVPSISGADGMAIDVTGNVYVATSSGVQVFNPEDGSLWGTIELPRTPANCAFGDTDKRTLYVTAREGLYRVRLPVVGI